MKQYRTQAIVLKRVDYQEADRIVTLLTSDAGKISVISRGVRKVKSKLAGGIELFTVNEVVIIEWRGEVQTLRSARMEHHYPQINIDYPRLQVGYTFLQAIDKVTEAEPEPGYFTLLVRAFEGLNDAQIAIPLIQVWFHLQLLALQGRQPNLATDASGAALSAEGSYRFNMQDGDLQPEGPLHAEHIKLARLCLQLLPSQLAQIKNGVELAKTWLLQLPALASH